MKRKRRITATAIEQLVAPHGMKKALLITWNSDEAKFVVWGKSSVDKSIASMAMALVDNALNLNKRGK